MWFIRFSTSFSPMILRFFARITELSMLRFYNCFVTFRKREEANLSISEVFGNRRKVIIICENKESTCTF